MYNDHFGLSADPFRVNPDPRFLYMSESHQEALATLIYAVNERKGFIVLTGEVGTGKTTIVNSLLQKLGDDVRAAYLFNTALETSDFFACLLEEFDIEPAEPFSKATALRRLNHYLIDRLRKGKQTLLVIDEAQNLSETLLEEIRMLSNLETPQSKLLQIILVGQPELSEKLERPQLRQLRQRVELRHSIRPLDAHQTAFYVRERLLIAGSEKGDLFSHNALRSVFRHAGGIPRVINVLCDNSLLGAFSAGEHSVSASLVEEAAVDMGLVARKLTEDEIPVPEVGLEVEQLRRQNADGWLKRTLGRRRAARGIEL